MKAPSWPVLIGSTLALAIAAAGSLAYRLGAFKDVKIERRFDGPYFVVSKDHMGAYHKIATVITEVETWAKANGEPCSLSFGEFYDNPETVDEDRLRSRGGCITSSDKVKSIASNGLLPAGYSTSTIDHRDALVASFDGSPAIGPWKVYSKVMADMKTLDLELNGPVLEIYEILSATSGRTRYIFPVRNLRTK